jgi:ComEC/Rec2-related protein
MKKKISKINISEYPALKLLLGIFLFFLLGSQVQFSLTYLIYLFPITTFLIIIFLLLKKYQLIYFVALIPLGFWLSYQVQGLSIYPGNKIIQEIPAILKGVVTQVINKKVNYIRCIVDCSLDAKALPRIENTTAILSIYKTDLKNLDIHAGSEIFVNAMIRPPMKGNIATDFPEAQYCASMNVHWLARANARNIAITDNPSGFYYIQEKIVTWIQQIITKLYPQEISGIVLALCTGDKSQISQEEKQIYSFTGTSHILAVSGLHIVLIAGIIFVFLGFIPNPWVKFIIFSILVAVFVIITGIQPSAIRAGIMAITVLFIRTLQRKAKIINTLSFVIIFLILIAPQLIVSAGFQMSVASVLGIFLLYEPINSFFIRNLKKDNVVVKYLVSSLAMTFSASIIVTPIVAIYFHVFSMISPLANLFMIPLMNLGLVISLLSILLYPISSFLAQIYANTSTLVIELAQNINHLAVKVPGAYIQDVVSKYISILVSISMLYLFLSSNGKQFITRCGVSLLFTAIFIIGINSVKFDKEIEVKPRNGYVANFFPMKGSNCFIFISDRKPKQYPLRDYSMEKYLIEYPDAIIMGINGNLGQNLFDGVSKYRNIKLMEISLETQKNLARRIGSKYPIPQIIEYQ